jgi:hypothetical protein
MGLHANVHPQNMTQVSNGFEWFLGVHPGSSCGKPIIPHDTQWGHKEQ